MAVLGGNRIPFARSNGAYAHASDQDMLTATLDGLVERFALEGERLGEVVAGAVLKHARDRDLTRESVLGSKLAPETPAYDVQQACGTGLETVITVANKIALGQIDVGIAGGVDTASDAPIAVNEDLRHILLDLNRAKSLPARARTLTRLRPGQIVPRGPAQRRAAHRAVDGRARRADGARLGRRRAPSRTSSRPPRTCNMAAAYERGFYDDLVTPYLGLERDQNLRAGLVGREAGEAQAGLRRRGRDDDRRQLDAADRRRLGGAAGQRGVGGGARPAGARVLRRRADRGRRPRPQGRGPADGARATRCRGCSTATGSSLRDFDLYEIHEAFASQVLATLKAWKDPVFAASGSGATRRWARSTAPSSTSTAARWPPGIRSPRPAGGSSPSLAKALDERGGGRGVISICAAGGQGVVAILEKAR